MPRTLRELVWAARGKEYAEWERAAEIWAVIAEANRNTKVKFTPFKATDLFRRPGRKSVSLPLTGPAFKSMKQAFVKPRP